MKHDYSKTLAVLGVWVAVSVVAIYAPQYIHDAAGYAVGATALIVIFL